MIIPLEDLKVPESYRADPDLTKLKASIFVSLLARKTKRVIETRGMTDEQVLAFRSEFPADYFVDVVLPDCSLWVYKDSEGKYTIVDGVLRYRVLKELGVKNVHCWSHD